MLAKALKSCLGGEGAALVWITVNVMASSINWYTLSVGYLLKQWYPTVTVGFEILQIWLTQRIQ